jgi:hypothetical protein
MTPRNGVYALLLMLLLSTANQNDAVSVAALLQLLDVSHLGATRSPAGSAAPAVSLLLVSASVAGTAGSYSACGAARYLCSCKSEAAKSTSKSAVL